MSGYLSPNQNYLVSVSRGSGSLRVIANANAKLRISVENKWVNVLEALGISTDGGGGALGSVLAGAQLVAGSNFLPQIVTSHVWRGSTGIELTLDMRFDAWSDPDTDVLSPVRSLISMFSPTRGGGNSAVTKFINGALSYIPGADTLTGKGGTFLQPPGPTPYSYAKSGKADPMLITVQLGRVMTIDTLIPVNIAWEFENRFDKSGKPVCALVTASFMSYVIPALDEIQAFFTGGTAGATSGFMDPASAAATLNSNVAVPANLFGNSTGYAGGL